jgi:hypothetical protein
MDQYGLATQRPAHQPCRHVDRYEFRAGSSFQRPPILRPHSSVGYMSIFGRLTPCGLRHQRGDHFHNDVGSISDSNTKIRFPIFIHILINIADAADDHTGNA